MSDGFSERLSALPPFAGLSVGSSGWFWRAALVPGPAAASLAVGLYGPLPGEQARSIWGSGEETISIGFSGQSRPNLKHTSSVRRPNYLAVTRALPES